MLSFSLFLVIYIAYVAWIETSCWPSDVRHWSLDPDRINALYIAFSLSLIIIYALFLFLFYQTTNVHWCCWHVANVTFSRSKPRYFGLALSISRYFSLSERINNLSSHTCTTFRRNVVIGCRPDAPWMWPWIVYIHTLTFVISSDDMYRTVTHM